MSPTLTQVAAGRAEDTTTVVRTPDNGTHTTDPDVPRVITTSNTPLLSMSPTATPVITSPLAAYRGVEINAVPPANVYDVATLPFPLTTTRPSGITTPTDAPTGGDSTTAEANDPLPVFRCTASDVAVPTTTSGLPSPFTSPLSSSVMGAVSVSSVCADHAGPVNTVTS